MIQEATVPRRVKVANLLAVIIPFLALIAAVVLLWGVAFNWVYLALLLSMYVITGLGITVGFHRLFTHKSFRTGKIGTWFWAIAGTMAAEGPLTEWVAFHRRHHQHSDDDHDPHSPHTHDHGTSLRGLIAGFWHSHAGWIIRRGSDLQPDIPRYAPDLLKDPIVVSVSKHWLLWILVGLAIPTVIAWAVTGTVVGALLGLLWGGIVRIFFVHHVTWSINSVCHMWGGRPFDSHDQSRNNVIFGILAFGEGWHNNHHAFPTSARHGLAWWQIDTSYMLIKVMQWLGMAQDVKVPSADRLAQKRRSDR